MSSNANERKHVLFQGQRFVSDPGIDEQKQVLTFYCFNGTAVFLPICSLHLLLISTTRCRRMKCMFNERENESEKEDTRSSDKPIRGARKGGELVGGILCFLHLYPGIISASQRE